MLQRAKLAVRPAGHREAVMGHNGGGKVRTLPARTQYRD